MNNPSLIALSYPAFRRFLIFKFTLTIAQQVQAVLVGWQIYELTKDPLSLGLIGLAEVIPNISVTLYGGYLADRFNRKRIILMSLIFWLLTLVLLALYAEAFSVWGLYSCIAITGFARGFIGPSAFGLMSEVVPKEHYVNSSAWSSSLWQVAAMLGSGGAGFLFAGLGYKYSYTFSLIFMMVAFLAISLIAYKPIKREIQTTPILKSIKEGIKFVFSDERIVGAMSLDMFAVLFGGAVALLPIFAEEILHTGAQGLGLLRAAPSLGAMLMALFLARFPPLKNSGKKLFLSIFLFGVCMIFFALSENFILSLICLFLSGALDNVSVVIRSTIMQTFTPEPMRGRVSSINSIFISSSNEIGAMESGVAAKMMGVVPSVVFGGAMTMLVVLMMLRLTPKLKKLEFA